MCLIAGGVNGNMREKLIRMIKAGKHRGPDGFGVWTDEGSLKGSDFSEVESIPDGTVGILQCRLRMRGSKDYIQPFFNEIVLAHNGEVYNYVQLREYLLRRGARFESNVDSEAILRLMEALLGEGLRPEEAVRRAMLMIEGDYAVAFVYRGRIYLLRDPLGIRPLYYSKDGFFGSERKVLWAIGEEAIPVRQGELVELFKGGTVRKRLLSPLELTRGKVGKLNEKTAVKAIETILRYSIRLRVGRKTGVLFSGGLDSSLLALIASEYSDVVLYTAGAEGSPDLEWARKAAESLGLELRESVFDREDVEKELRKIVFAIEEPNPMNLAIAIPIYFSAKAARRDGIRILLSGQGADELFGGYMKYVERPELMERDLLEIGERNLARDDKVIMANGIEGRFPFLTLPLVQVALRTPSDLKIHNGERKYVLRRAALRMGLPKELAERAKKAAQYGSGAQRILEKIAKERGISLRGLAESLFAEVFSRSSA
ncbi:asparagine synthase (glutamine-hydrolyzing) [Thermococcus sp.]